MIRNGNCWILASVCVLTLASEVLARPGGRGGSRGGNPGNRVTSPGNNVRPNAAPGVQNPGGGVREQLPAGNNSTAGDRGARTQSVQEFLGTPSENRPSGDNRPNYTPENQPFTAAWYADHPNAWKATHPHADAYVAATTAGLASWLAIGAAPVGTTAVVSSEPAVVADQAAEETTFGNSDTTQNGPADDSQEWMQVGVYNVAETGNSNPTRMVQLDVSRDGKIRGNYFDILSNQVTLLAGEVNKETQAVAWTIGANGKVVFRTTLSALTQPSGTVQVQFPNGKSSSWLIGQVKQ